jgi:hypothetical protein
LLLIINKIVGCLPKDIWPAALSAGSLCISFFQKEEGASCSFEGAAGGRLPPNIPPGAPVVLVTANFAGAAMPSHIMCQRCITIWPFQLCHSVGTIVDFVFAQHEGPLPDGSCHPLYILVDFPDYSSPALLPLSPTLVPVIPVEMHSFGCTCCDFPF